MWFRYSGSCCTSSRSALLQWQERRSIAYIPDGRGIIWHGRRVGPGETVIADDDLVLYFTKALLTFVK